MNNTIFLGLLLIGTGVTFILVKPWVDYLTLKYKARSLPRLIKYDRLKIRCTDHVWEYVTLAMAGIYPGEYDVCHKCGVIRDREDVMLSVEAVQQLQESMVYADKKEKAREVRNEKILRLTEQHVKIYLMKHFAEEVNDPAYVRKLEDFASYVLEAKNSAVQQVAVGDDDTLSAHWSKQEGNA